jgi:flagellar motor switch protein FliN
MPDTMNAPAETQPNQEETTSQPDGTTQTAVRPVGLPEAPQSVSAPGGGQLDILLDMEIPITVVLGATQIPVKRLLQLGPGSVLRLEKPIEAPADLFLKDSKFAEADVVVVDNRFAVRIKQIVGTGQPAATTQG